MCKFKNFDIYKLKHLKKCYNIVNELVMIM